MKRKLAQRFYENNDTGGSTPPSETPASAPESPVTPSTPAVATEVASHVAEAATGASEAAKSTGDEGWRVVASELKGLRADIQGLVKASTPASAAPAASPKPAAPANVSVAAPEKKVKKVLRNGRWVTREVKA